MLLDYQLSMVNIPGIQGCRLSGVNAPANFGYQFSKVNFGYLFSKVNMPGPVDYRSSMDCPSLPQQTANTAPQASMHCQLLWGLSDYQLSIDRPFQYEQTPYMARQFLQELVDHQSSTDRPIMHRQMACIALEVYWNR